MIFMFLRDNEKKTLPERIYNPIAEMGFFNNVYLSAEQH